MVGLEALNRAEEPARDTVSCETLTGAPDFIPDLVFPPHSLHPTSTSNVNAYPVV